jgi:hypothetical protein
LRGVASAAQLVRAQAGCYRRLMSSTPARPSLAILALSLSACVALSACVDGSAPAPRPEMDASASAPEDAGGMDAGQLDAAPTFDARAMADAGIAPPPFVAFDAGMVPQPDDDGGEPAPQVDVDDDAGAPDGMAEARIVFVSSTLYGGALGGPDGADARCAQLASEAGLVGSYAAWLSSTTSSAAARLQHADVPHVRLDGVRVADDWQDLIDGTLAAPISIDERGQTRTDDVWTGTQADGSPDALDTCEGFTREDAAVMGLCGSAAATGVEWTSNQRPTCDTRLRIYCLEQ